MKHPLTIDKSVAITFKDKKILVDELPDDLKYEIHTLDKMNQDKINLLYELEKLELAAQTKKIQINKLLIDFYEPKKESEE